MSSFRLVLTGFDLAVGYANASMMGVSLAESAFWWAALHFVFGVLMFMQAFAMLQRLVQR